MKTQTLKIPKLNINRLNEQSTHFRRLERGSTAKDLATRSELAKRK